jgi:predicted alpha/beta-hydrolase family hydrolase
MLVVLAGREPRSAAELKTLLESAGIPASVQRYSFWAGDVSNPETKSEVDALALQAPSHIIAKSIGTLIAILACRQHQVGPMAALFLGVPLNRLRAEARTDLLCDYCREVPTTIVQRTGDPTGSFSELADVLSSCPEVALHELAGDSHDYSAEDAAAIVRDWWSTASSQ